MSNKSVFKFIRAIPTPDGGRQPDFYRYSQWPMRQIPTLIQTVNASGIAAPAASSFVPASSWGYNKLLLIRTSYVFEWPAGPPPAFVDVVESIEATGTSGISLPRPSGSFLFPGIFSTTIFRTVIRVADELYGWDMGNVALNSYANDLGLGPQVIQFPHPAGAIDFSSQIQVDLNFTIDPSLTGATITPLWAEAFLEQGTNLGKLP